MNFSHTFIAIRKRSLLGLFDLSLLVYRDHALNILTLLMINAMPWLAFDLLTLLLSEFGMVDYGQWHWKLLLLAAIQAQYGTMMITLYLGKAMFEGRPSVSETVSSFFKASWYSIWLHGCLRMVFPVTLLIAVGDSFATGWAICLFMLGMLFRMSRPFVSEILLLEKTPVRRKNQGEMLFNKRSSDLHHSDLVAGFVLGSLVAVALTTMLAGLLFHIDKTIGLLGTLDLPIQYLYWPVAAWLVASYMAVFRFMFYINTRIVQEGWEVSLKMMSEGQKLEQSLQ